MNKKLTDAGLKYLPFELRTQPTLFQLLAADNKDAASAEPPRTPFTYVDLTHKDLLPFWLCAEAVGGHTPRPGEIAWDTSADTSSVSNLGRVLKGALEKPRYFKSMTQWSAVWNRYAPTAVSMLQMTWAHVIAHADNVYELAEEEKYSRTGDVAVAFIYDDMLRKASVLGCYRVLELIG